MPRRKIHAESFDKGVASKLLATPSYFAVSRIMRRLLHLISRSGD